MKSLIDCYFYIDKLVAECNLEGRKSHLVVHFRLPDHFSLKKRNRSSAAW